MQLRGKEKNRALYGQAEVMWLTVGVRKYERRVFADRKKKEYEGERTSLWALEKLNWTNASLPPIQKQRREKCLAAWGMASIAAVHSKSVPRTLS